MIMRQQPDLKVGGTFGRYLVRHHSRPGQCAVVVRLSSDQQKRAEALGRIIQETDAALRQARSDSPDTIVDLLARRSEAEAELNSIIMGASAERRR